MIDKSLKHAATFGVLALGLLLLACVPNQKAEVAQDAHGEAGQDIIAYGQMCAQAIREIPAFSCQSGVEIPITVRGGQTPVSYKPDMDCDRPSLLPLGADSDGQCVPYSRVLDLSSGDNQVAVLCRQKKIRSADSIYFDEVDIVAHSAADGSTCWFQATGKNGQPLDTTRVPPPNELVPPPGHVAARDFWNPPAEVAADGCGNCHDNDPFMFSPYIGQVWEHVPTDPLGWYKSIGADFAHWQPVSLSTRNNPCVGCHRLGVEFTSGQATEEATGRTPIKNADLWAQQYPASHFMPTGNFHSEAQWNVIYQKAVDEILACHQNPEADGCLTVPITGKPEG